MSDKFNPVNSVIDAAVGAAERTTANYVRQLRAEIAQLKVENERYKEAAENIHMTLGIAKGELKQSQQIIADMLIAQAEKIKRYENALERIANSDPDAFEWKLKEIAIEALKLISVLAICGLLCGCGPKTDSVNATNDVYASGGALSHLTNGTDNVHFGKSITLSNAVIIGAWAQSNITKPLRNIVVIGDGAHASNDYELVIRFEDGSELRQQLPEKNVDLRGFREGLFNKSPTPERRGAGGTDRND